jgi:hypothetical protein
MAERTQVQIAARILGRLGGKRRSRKQTAQRKALHQMSSHPGRPRKPFNDLSFERRVRVASEAYAHALQTLGVDSRKTQGWSTILGAVRANQPLTGWQLEWAEEAR